MPRPPHSQPGALSKGSSLTACAQFAVVAVDWRHARTVSRFRAKQPETGAGAEIGASTKANQRLGRLWTSARKATDVQRPPSRAPPPAFPRERFWRPVMTPEGKREPARPEN